MEICQQSHEGRRVIQKKVNYFLCRLYIMSMSSKLLNSGRYKPERHSRKREECYIPKWTVERTFFMEKDVEKSL